MRLNWKTYTGVAKKRKGKREEKKKKGKFKREKKERIRKMTERKQP